jgi:hypothetical protein
MFLYSYKSGLSSQNTGISWCRLERWQGRVEPVWPIWVARETEGCAVATACAYAKSERGKKMTGAYQPEVPCFSLDEREQRWGRVRQLMARDRLDVIVVPRFPADGGGDGNRWSGARARVLAGVSRFGH